MCPFIALRTTMIQNQLDLPSSYCFVWWGSILSRIVNPHMSDFTYAWSLHYGCQDVYHNASFFSTIFQWSSCQLLSVRLFNDWYTVLSIFPLKWHFKGTLDKLIRKLIHLFRLSSFSDWYWAFQSTNVLNHSGLRFTCLYTFKQTRHLQGDFIESVLNQVIL